MDTFKVEVETKTYTEERTWQFDCHGIKLTNRINTLKELLDLCEEKEDTMISATPDLVKTYKLICG
jgi:hypothetical protein